MRRRGASRPSCPGWRRRIRQGGDKSALEWCWRWPLRGALHGAALEHRGGAPCDALSLRRSSGGGGAAARKERCENRWRRRPASCSLSWAPCEKGPYTRRWRLSHIFVSSWGARFTLRPDVAAAGADFKGSRAKIEVQVAWGDPTHLEALTRRFRWVRVEAGTLIRWPRLLDKDEECRAGSASERGCSGWTASGQCGGAARDARGVEQAPCSVKGVAWPRPAGAGAFKRSTRANDSSSEAVD